MTKHKINTFLKKVPFVGAALSFSWQVWQDTFKELLFLWILTSSPILLYAMIQTVQETTADDIAQEVLNLNILLIYTTAFISPLLYTLAKRLSDPQKNHKIFPQPILILTTSILILICSVAMFQNEVFKTVNESTGTIISLVIYVISLYFWALSIADSNNNSSYIDYENEEQRAFVNATKVIGDKK